MDYFLLNSFIYFMQPGRISTNTLVSESTQNVRVENVYATSITYKTLLISNETNMYDFFFFWLLQYYLYVYLNTAYYSSNICSPEQNE